MYPLGLLPLLQAWIPDHAVLKLIIALPSVVFLALLWSWAVEEPEEEDMPVSLPLSSLRTISPFFKSRFDFLTRRFQLTGKSIFQFSLLRVCIIHFPRNPRLIVAASEYSHCRLRRIWEERFLFLQGTGYQRGLQSSVWSRMSRFLYRNHIKPH